MPRKGLTRKRYGIGHGHGHARGHGHVHKYEFNSEGSVGFLRYVLPLIALSCLCGCAHSGKSLHDIRQSHAEHESAYLSLVLEELPDEPLTLQDVLSLALERNLDLLVKAKQTSYARELATGAMLKMMPALSFSAEASGRNRNTGMSSKSLEPTVPPAPPSISVEEATSRFDLTFTWNLLDFGLSFYKARQEVNKLVMRRCEYLKARLTLLSDTTTNYWKARVAQRGYCRAAACIERAQRLLDGLERQMGDQTLAKDVGLRYKAELLRVAQEKLRYEHIYHEAIGELARLIGSPYPCFELADEPLHEPLMKLPDICELAEVALDNRPELYGFDAEERVSRDDAEMAILKIFPTLTPFGSYNYDGNNFVLYHHWLAAGIRVVSNLLAIPYYFQERVASLCSVDVSRANRLAMSVAILTQLSLGYMNYVDSTLELVQAEEIARTRAELADVMQRRSEEGDVSPIEAFAKYQLDAIQAEIDAMRAYGNQQVAIEQINSSIGVPFYLNPWLSCEECQCPSL